jgi:nucleoside-diphosphate-sugar epimerase
MEQDLRKVLLTGSKGFIGQNLKIELIKQGFDVLEINEDIFLSKGWKVELLLLLIRNKPKVIFHVGACSDTLEKDVNYMMVLNFEFTKLLVDWSVPFNDVDLLLYNLGSLGQHYKSWTQYRIQNGLAPLEPAIKNMIQYYRVALNELDYSDEEVIVAVHKFRYSFLLCD